MKRLAIWVSVLALAFAASPAQADDAHQKENKTETEKAQAMTIKGEIVDTGCYLGHGARGEKHISCATKCIKNGMPMAVLTNDGELYLVTMNHDNPDAYNALKELAGQLVSVTGMVMERNGMKGIDVTAYAVATTSAK